MSTTNNSSKPARPAQDSYTLPADPLGSFNSRASRTAQAEGNAVGQDIGTRSKGFFNAVSGAGEAIRGTINSSLDGVGDGIAGREQGTVESREKGENHGDVTNKGMADFKQGVADLLDGKKTQ
ncbi:hypothetical protein JCM10212_006431 [Sporobolomyces blumeae]